MTLRDCLRTILLEYVVKSDLPRTNMLSIEDIEALTDHLFSSGLIPVSPNQIYVPDWTDNTVPPSAGKKEVTLPTTNILQFPKRTL